MVGHKGVQYTASQTMRRPQMLKITVQLTLAVSTFKTSHELSNTKPLGGLRPRMICGVASNHV